MKTALFSSFAAGACLVAAVICFKDQKIAKGILDFSLVVLNLFCMFVNYKDAKEG